MLTANSAANETRILFRLGDTARGGRAGQVDAVHEAYLA